MKRWLTRILWWLLGLLLLGVALGGGLLAWLATPQARDRLTQEASAALGVGISVAQIEVLAWPGVALQLSNVALQTQPPLTLRKLVLRPAWGAALRGRVALAAFDVQGAELSQRALDKLMALQKKKHDAQIKPGLEAENANSSEQLPQRITFDEVTWVSSQGKRTTLRGKLRMSDLGWLDEATLEVMGGAFLGTKVQVLRTDEQWALDGLLGGGKVTGTLTLHQTPGQTAAWALAGQVQTRNVALARLTPAPVLSGQLEADTSLSAHAATLGGLVDVLQTQSRFAVRHAVLHGVDLARAVSTVGLSRGGQTPLDTLAGQVSSQGRVLQFSQLVASSGALSVAGQVRVAENTALSGRIQVVLGAATLGSAVGVPLEVSGTLADPQVALTRSALLGAAVGTAVLPGVGTGAGASLGDRLGNGINKLFGR